MLGSDGCDDMLTSNLNRGFVSVDALGSFVQWNIIGFYSVSLEMVTIEKLEKNKQNLL